MIPEKKKILIIAGEASGDLHGSGVVKALLQLSSDVQVYGVGGGNMRQAGAELIIDSSRLAVVGITEVFGKIGNLVRAYWQLKQFIKTNHLALLILIDFPDFNLLLARVAKGMGVPVLYYISPQVWAWRSGRVKKIAERVDKMAVILPFEVPIFRKVGLDVEFVGHPLLDLVGLHQQEIAFPHVEEWKGDPLVTLLPGSRTKEVKSLLPGMMRAVEVIRENKPGAKFILALAPGLSIQEVEKFLTSSTDYRHHCSGANLPGHPGCRLGAGGFWNGYPGNGYPRQTHGYPLPSVFPELLDWEGSGQNKLDRPGKYCCWKKSGT